MYKLLIISLSFIFDLIATIIFPQMRNNLSLFTSLIVPITIYLIYPLYNKRTSNYLITSFFIGEIYDLIFTNLLLFNGILFILIAIITYILNKHFNINKFTNIIFIILIITFYETTSSTIFIILNNINITTNDIIYKITHSLLINILYGYIMYYFLNRKKKYELK